MSGRVKPMPQGEAVVFAQISAAHEAAPLWGMTCLFNPCRYRARPANFRQFRHHLAIPLVAVELSFDGHFDLEPGDADVLVRLRGESVLWHKERLLQIGLGQVPAACRKVAWLDADIVFERRDWVEEAVRALDRCAVVQLFSHSWDLAPGAALDRSAAYASSMGLVFAASQGASETVLFGASERRSQNSVPPNFSLRHPGFAWAVRRSILEEVGLYDRCVVGGGDRAVACASFGKHETADQAWKVTEAQRSHYIAWAERWDGAVQGRVGFVPGNLFHLFHGSIARRGYGKPRSQILAAHGFDPALDVHLAANGALAWATDKPRLHEAVREYFESRREDDVSAAQSLI